MNLVKKTKKTEASESVTAAVHLYAENEAPWLQP